jgi:hypothetical protein
MKPYFQISCEQILNPGYPISLMVLRKGGKEMPKKEEKSRGNFFDFIEDAAKDPKLHKKMVHTITTRGKGMKPEGLLREFYALGYDGVNLRDCKKILEIVDKTIVDPSKWDWAY